MLRPHEKQTPGRPKCFSFPLGGRTPQGGGLGGAQRTLALRHDEPELVRLRSLLAQQGFTELVHLAALQAVQGLPA